MKGKSVWFVVLCFVPATLAASYVTKGFRRLSVGGFLVFAILLLLLLLFVWHRYVDRPTADFYETIRRALNGDFRARFSCSEENDNFKKLSHVFNQLMSSVENQTEELLENRLFQTQLYENEKIYRSALELTCERVFEADLTHNRMIYGQEIYRRAFPFLNTEMFDDMVRDIAKQAVYEEDVEKFYRTFSRSSLLSAFRSYGSAEISLEYRQKSPDGGVFWVSTTAILLNRNQDESLKIIGYVKNIDERKRRDLEILKQSQKDGLTGLYNRKFTQVMIESFLQDEGKCGRHAVIMVDIDDFKRINDTLGHIQGDAALTALAQKQQELFRASDVVGRIGGDEFLVLMKNYGSSEVLQEKLKALQEVLHRIHLEDSDYRVSGSIGVTLYPEDGATYNELYKNADLALYRSKEHGKNRFSFYRDSLRETCESGGNT